MDKDFKILVIENDAEVRNTIAQILGQKNIAVSFSEGSDLALQAILEVRPHLVLLDVAPTQMKEYLKKIKELDSSLLVIIITEANSIECAIEAVKEGAYNYLLKPINSASFTELIECALRTFNKGELDFQRNREQFERDFIVRALKTFRGKINQTALQAKIPKKTLLRKLQKYNIKAEDYRL